jgi:hypothetical protein
MYVVVHDLDLRITPTHTSRMEGEPGVVPFRVIISDHVANK